MKHLKYGVSFVSVAVALVVASFGGGFVLSPSQPEQTDVVSVEKSGGLVGTNGLHW
jgi:hypothetical protein